jgi:raffinose/stachyose/melibiose transport system permease protein
LLPPSGFRGEMETGATRWLAYLFVAPALALFGLLVLYPAVATMVLSCFSWKAMSATRQWVGWANYAELARDPYFFLCLRNNALWVGLSLLVQLPLALGLAVALNAGLTRFHLLRTAFFTPFVLPVVAVALVWWLIAEPNFGLANALLSAAAAAGGRLLAALGLRPPPPTPPAYHIAWLGDPRLANFFLIGVASWKYLGFHTVVLLAGLQAISEEYYEAARLDGASGWQAFRHITLPLLRQVIAVDALLITVGSVKVFDLVWVMTGGGPHHATEVLATYMYYCGFTIDRMGYAAALATIMFLLTLAATVAYLRLTRLPAEEVAG